MTRAEWHELADRMRAAWRNQKLPQETEEQWWRMLKRYQYDAVRLALADLSAKRQWMPTLADIVFDARRIEREARPPDCLLDDPDALGHEGMAERAREYLNRKRTA